MTIRSRKTSWKPLRIGLVPIFLLLAPSATFAAPALVLPPIKSTALERQMAARSTSPDARLVADRESGLSIHVGETRRVLIELRAFIDKAAETAELGKRLRSRQEENDRLRQILLTHQAAKDTFVDRLRPTDVMVSTLTKTIVRNWLETVRLNHRSGEITRELHASKRSSSALQDRIAILKRMLRHRRAELLMLKAKRAALNAALSETRR